MRRSSALPFAIHCGHASTLAERYPETSAASTDGTSTHAEISAGIRGEAEPTSEQAKAAVAWVRKLIHEMKRGGIDPELCVEREIYLLDDETHDYELLTVGHLDLSIETAEIVHIVDWKRSKWGNVPEPDHNPQLISYGLARSLERPFQMHLIFGDDQDEWGNVRPKSSGVICPNEHATLTAWIRTLATRDASLQPSGAAQAGRREGHS